MARNPDEATEEFAKFLSALAQLGAIPEMAGWATDEFAAIIRQRHGNRSLFDLTVGEILELDREHRAKHIGGRR